MHGNARTLILWHRDTPSAIVERLRGEAPPRSTRAEQLPARRFDIAASFVRGVGLPGNSEAEAAVAAAIGAARSSGPAAAVPRLPTVLLQAGREESKLLATALWLRLAAARLLVWNHNYNVKPREISAAQEKLTAALTDIWLAWCACTADTCKSEDANGRMCSQPSALAVESSRHQRAC